MGVVINLEKLDDRGNVVVTIPLYASNNVNKIYRRLDLIRNSFVRDMEEYGWEMDIRNCEGGFVVYGDVDHNYGTVASRYVIESIEIL